MHGDTKRTIRELTWFFKNRPDEYIESDGLLNLGAFLMDRKITNRRGHPEIYRITLDPSWNMQNLLVLDVVFRSVNFNNCNFANSHFGRCRIYNYGEKSVAQGVNFDNCVFKNVNMGTQAFAGSSFKNVVGSHLSVRSFYYSDLSGAKLNEVRITTVSTNSKFHNCYMVNASIDGFNAYMGDDDSYVFQSCDLRGASISNSEFYLQKFTKNKYDSNTRISDSDFGCATILLDNKEYHGQRAQAYLEHSQVQLSDNNFNQTKYFGIPCAGRATHILLPIVISLGVLSVLVFILHK